MSLIVAQCIFLLTHYHQDAKHSDAHALSCCTLPWKRKAAESNMAAAAPASNEKEPVNIVHRNAIFCETIHKEQRHQKLYTHYGVNPYKKSKAHNLRMFIQPLPLS